MPDVRPLKKGMTPRGSMTAKSDEKERSIKAVMLMIHLRGGWVFKDDRPGNMVL
jgi:hypothetical protein